MNRAIAPANAIRANGFSRGRSNLLRPGITWHRLKKKRRKCIFIELVIIWYKTKWEVKIKKLCCTNLSNRKSVCFGNQYSKSWLLASLESCNYLSHKTLPLLHNEHKNILLLWAQCPLLSRTFWMIHSCWNLPCFCFIHLVSARRSNG